MKSSQTPFEGSVAIGVLTAHGIETRYVSNEARGTLASVDVPCVSTENPEGNARRDERRTVEDRTPEADSSSISNAQADRMEVQMSKEQNPVSGCTGLSDCSIFRVIILASYCSDCTDDAPCKECLQECNVADIEGRIVANHGGFDYFRSNASNDASAGSR